MELSLDASILFEKLNYEAAFQDLTGSSKALETTSFKDEVLSSRNMETYCYQSKQM